MHGSRIARFLDSEGRTDLMARTRFSELRDTVVVKPGASKRLADLRVEALERSGAGSGAGRSRRRCG